MKTMNVLKESGWPQWPQYTEKTGEALNEVLNSNRWAISGYWTGTKTREQMFAKRFAKYNGVKYCVPTTNGSSALAIALESLGVGYGDEVIMPSLTWIATATAILRVNAKPILIDVLEETYCMDTSKIEAAITDKTKAIIVVHLMECMVNMDEVMKLAKKYNVSVLEDCAQVHGMVWNGKRAGTIGDIGAFSFQQGKILTAGEGGATVTNNEEYYHRMVQLRSDSRRFVADNMELKVGDMELESAATRQGYNFCLSEFQASILLEQMEQLDEYNQIKISNAKMIKEKIENILGFSTVKIPKEVTYQTFYGLMIKMDKDYFKEQKDVDRIVKALCSQLKLGSFFIHPMYKPVHKNELFCPWTSNRYNKEFIGDEHYWRTLSYPVAERAHSEVIIIHHSLLLATANKINELCDALYGISKEQKRWLK